LQKLEQIHENYTEKYSTFSNICGKLIDPRMVTKGNLKHELDEILFLAVSSAVCRIMD
jgi:hypothetical protein